MSETIFSKTEKLSDLILRHCAEDSIQPIALPRVTLLHFTRPTGLLHSLYKPAFCVIAQGRKQSVLGRQVFEYKPGKYMVVSVDVPVTGQILEASGKTPYLCMALALEPGILADLLLETGDPQAMDSSPNIGLGVSDAPPELLDATIRLLSLMDRPEDMPMLAPLAEREILYWLLKGEQGDRLRQIAWSESKLQHVNRAIEWLRHFSEQFHIEDLAREACMSQSNLYHHFKSITTMTPLQYQKQLRLQEARRLMLSGAMDASTAGREVGYGSPSQFSREYSRLFGAPPSRDLARLRESAVDVQYTEGMLSIE